MKTTKVRGTLICNYRPILRVNYTIFKIVADKNL